MKIKLDGDGKVSHAQEAPEDVTTLKEQIVALQEET